MTECRFLTENDYITTTNINKKFVGEWSVLLISCGKKMYLSKLYKRGFSSKTYGYSETKLKLSDEATLKLTYEFAIKVAQINKSRDNKVGIVNLSGLQKIL